MRRLLLLVLAVPLLAVPPAHADDRPPVTGAWRLTFTPASVKEVGVGVSRQMNDDRCSVQSCHSSFRFEKPGAGDGRTTEFFVPFDATGCPAAPCDVRAFVQSNGYGFDAALHYDGTTYSGTGEGLYSTTTCKELIPKDTDAMRFTVEGPDSAPRMTGEITALLGATFEVDGDRCKQLLGYEIYTGSFTGQPAFGNPGLVGVGGRGGLPGSAGSSGGSATTAARRADAVAAATHSRPILSTRVATARDLPWRPGPVLASALLAMLLVLLMPFPAALFNGTLERNYAEVSGWFRRGPPRAEGEAVRPPRGWPHAALAVGAVAVLSAFLDPDAGFDRATAVLVAGLLLSIAAVTLLASLPGRLYQARRYGERARIAIYPAGLAIAAACVLVSRLTSFEPGYLYGIVIGFAFARELSSREEGRLLLVTSGLLLLAAVAAFVLRIPVHDAVVSDGGIALELLDTVLAAVFAAGVEANVLGLLPIRFMKGEVLFGWSKVAWAVAFGVNVFAFLHALSAAAGAATTGASATVAAVLFLAFGAVSVAFWAYFRFRRTDPTPASV